MATLSSPGVSVTVIDESFYTPAAPGTVPLIVVASASNKQNASGTGTAQGTLDSNVGKVWIITSQRDLTDTFGTPLFYTDTSGNALHGGEINEYGLQAAYSLLGATSRAYVVRADVDLGQLDPLASAPTGDPVAGTFWVDTKTSIFGINEWNSSGQGSFTVKTPLIIDNSNYATVSSGGVPLSSFGQQGDYAMYVTSENTNKLWYKNSSNVWVEVKHGFNGGKSLTVSPHYQFPAYTTATTNGSVWVKTTTPGLGANWSVKYFNGATSSWSTVSAPIYSSTAEAIGSLDSGGGGQNIPVGSIMIDSNYENGAGTDLAANFKLWRRASSGPTSVVFAASNATEATTSTFTIRETTVNSSTFGATVTVTIQGSTTTSVASLIPAALSAQSGIKNVTATYDSVAGTLTFSHSKGGDFELNDGTNDPISTAISVTTQYPGLTAYNPVTKAGTPGLNVAPSNDGFQWLVSNWRPLTYQAQMTAPTSDPVDGRYWFSSVVDQVDVLVNDVVGGVSKWVGYKNYSGHTGTDVNGPLVSATEPTVQSTGGALKNGDVWISTADMENYGKNIYVYSEFTKKWVLQDTTDQTSPNGWLFADARWATSGAATSPSTVKALLTSDYVDPDAPDPALYPKGMKLWNTRRSGYNVKRYVKNYIDVTANSGINVRYPTDTDMSGYSTDRWVTFNGTNEDGSGKFGRHAQRGQVVAALKSLIDTSPAIRDTDTLTFNLIACPGYPEVIANMVSLNVDRDQTAFVIGDTPFRLEPNATKLNAWGLNTNGAFDNGDDGAVTYDSYMAMFYPSGFTTDNTGNNIVVPPSHMMLRTIINSDAKSYQWFAPAGIRRGTVDNATSVGYIESATGEFKTASLYQGLRDVLQSTGVNINPIATLPGVGIVNYGQKTRQGTASALDRINVARLVAFLRRQLSILAKPFLFEPNDAQTRREIKAAIDSLLLELVGQRALYDFVVVCDTTNNTPSRIDRSELWVDIAIEPVKAVEFIYIPLRIKKTGSIAAGV